ncbi:MAG: SOS response-associated peptidase family protein [Acholeplasmataceae bacterium]
MCGRYFLNQESVETYLPDINSEVLKLVGFNEIYPSQSALVKTKHNFGAQNWGYQTTFSSQLIINARLETILEKPLFKDDYQKRRCIIIASSYFEWSDKIKYQLNTPNPLIYFAGIYQNEENPEFTIITKAAQNEIDWVHHRMPVILNGQTASYYLAGTDLNKLILPINLNVNQINENT